MPRGSSVRRRFAKPEMWNARRHAGNMLRIWNPDRMGENIGLLSVETAPLLKSLASVLSALVLLLSVLSTLPAHAKVWKLGEVKTVTWEHHRHPRWKKLAEKRVQITLTVEGPEKTGYPDVYELHVSDPKAFNPDSAMSLAFSKPGSIMVAAEDTKFYLETVWLKMAGDEYKPSVEDSSQDWKKEAAKILMGEILKPFGLFANFMEVLEKYLGMEKMKFTLVTHQHATDWKHKAWKPEEWDPPPVNQKDYYTPEAHQVFSSDREYDVEIMAWIKSDKWVYGTEMIYCFKVGREADDQPEADTLYLRLVLPYAYWAYKTGPHVWRYAEIEWKVELPGKKEVRPIEVKPGLMFPTAAKSDNNPHVIFNIGGKEFRVMLRWRAKETGVQHTIEVHDAFIDEKGYINVVCKSSCVGCGISLHVKNAKGVWVRLTSAEKTSPLKTYTLRAPAEPGGQDEPVEKPKPSVKWPKAVEGDTNPQITWTMEGKEFRLYMGWNPKEKGSFNTQTLRILDASVDEQSYLNVKFVSTCHGCAVVLEVKEGDSWKRLAAQRGAHRDKAYTIRASLR